MSCPFDDLRAWLAAVPERQIHIHCYDNRDTTVRLWQREARKPTDHPLQPRPSPYVAHTMGADLAETLTRALAEAAARSPEDPPREGRVP